jgi:S-adenosylmethionine/arginine decarboxylase-like enzyme
MILMTRGNIFMRKKNKSYGRELVLDLHNCNPRKFARAYLRKYFRDLCKLIDMERCKLVWWDDCGLPAEECQTLSHLKGTSAVQFIMTSNITIHTLDLLGNVYLNIFSCKEFDVKQATEFSKIYFEGKVVASTTIIRR